MTDVTDVEEQLRALLRDAYDRVEYATDFEDKLLYAADRAVHTQRPLWPRVGAGLLAAALVAGLAIGAAVLSHGRPQPATPATPAASAPDIRMLNLGVAPDAGLTIVGAATTPGGCCFAPFTAAPIWADAVYKARHLIQSFVVRGPHGTYGVDALQPGDRLHTVFRLPALTAAQRLKVGRHPGFYFACNGHEKTKCSPVLAWRYRPHAWAVVSSNDSTAAAALRDVAEAVRFTEQTPMRTAVALPYAPQQLPPVAIFAQYAHYPGATGGHRSLVFYGSPAHHAYAVEVAVSSGSLSAKQRTGRPVTVDGRRGYLRRSHGILTLDFTPASHQVVEVSSLYWTKSELTGFASQLRFAADLTDVHTWFDARSAVP